MIENLKEDNIRLEYLDTCGMWQLIIDDVAIPLTNKDISLLIDAQEKSLVTTLREFFSSEEMSNFYQNQIRNKVFNQDNFEKIVEIFKKLKNDSDEIGKLARSAERATDENSKEYMLTIGKYFGIFKKLSNY